MKLKGLNEYDICNYRAPSMFLIFPNCSFKCDKECGRPICQNSALAHEPEIEVRAIDLIHRYLKNPLTHAIVCGGLEPFDSWDDLWSFICVFRGFSNDPVIIYTGYIEEEIKDKINFLARFGNIIVKFGRFMPDSPHIFDTVLGVELASNNQYAKRLQIENGEMLDDDSIANRRKNKTEEYGYGN